VRQALCRSHPTRVHSTTQLRRHAIYLIRTTHTNITPQRVSCFVFKAPGTGLYRCEVHAISEEQAECANQVAAAVAAQMGLAEGVATLVVMAPEPFHKAHASSPRG